MNALATAIYFQWYWTYNKRMKPCKDNNNSSDGDNSDGINSNDAGDGSDGPPRKKTRTITVANDNTLLRLSKPDTYVDNEATSINAIPTDASSVI